MSVSSKVLVTGAGGFIGSHLCERLVQEGFQVRAMVHYRSDSTAGWLDKSTFASQMEIVRGDVRDAAYIRNVSKDVDTVFHLAALIGIPYSYQAPESYIDVNVKGSLNVFQAAKDFGFQVIHTSTSEVYGTARTVPINEEHPLQGQSPYSASKIAADQMAFAFYSSFGTRIKTVRPFNTFGPRQSERAVIPTIISQLKMGRSLHLGSVTPTRDFCFVEDTAQGFLKAAVTNSGYGQVFNIARGEELSIADTAQIIAEIMGKREIEFVQDTQRLRPVGSEVERLWADTSKSLRDLDWHPEYAGASGFKAALSKTVDHYLSRADFGLNASRYVT